MPLILPNTIANEIPADGDKLQQNFETIQDWANQNAITADGSTAMVAPLLLPGAPTQPNQAATKEYADTRGWIDSGFQTIGPKQQAAVGSIMHVSAGLLMKPFDVRMFVTGSCSVGSDSSQVASITGTILTNVAGTNMPVTPQTISGGPNQFAHVPLTWTWVVPAGGNCEFAVHGGWVGFTGSIYTAASVMWQRVRA
jgi:hypothetical protein